MDRDAIDNFLGALRGSEAFERRCHETAIAALELRRLRDCLHPIDTFRPQPFGELLKKLCAQAGLNDSALLAAAGLAREYTAAQAFSFARLVHALGLRMVDALSCLQLDLPEAMREPLWALESGGLGHAEQLEILLSEVEWSKESRDLLEEFSRALQREYERD
jgi:hypothetical protein